MSPAGSTEVSAVTEVTEVAEVTGASGHGFQISAGLLVPRVDLLPPEVLEERVFRRTRRRLAGVAALVVLALAAAFGLGLLARERAADTLALAQARGAELTAQQAEYVEVPRTQAAVDSMEGALATAMGGEVLWYRYLGQLALTTPDGVWFTRLTATASAPGAAVVAPAAPTSVAEGATAADPAVAADPAAAAVEAAAVTPPPVPGANPLAPTGIGALTVSARGRQHPDTATWLETLDATPGLASATFTTSTRVLVGSTPVIDVESGAVVTADALSHRYDQGAR